MHAHTWARTHLQSHLQALVHAHACWIPELSWEGAVETCTRVLHGHGANSGLVPQDMAPILQPHETPPPVTGDPHARVGGGDAAPGMGGWGAWSAQGV